MNEMLLREIAKINQKFVGEWMAGLMGLSIATAKTIADKGTTIDEIKQGAKEIYMTHLDCFRDFWEKKSEEAFAATIAKCDAKNAEK